MKHLLFACAALLVMMTACCKNEAPKEKGALEVIKARTSIRSFTGKKLTEDQIHTLLDAAMAAPTDANIQPWRFIVITDDEIKAGLYQGEKHKHMVTTAGAVIVVCGETTRMVKPRDAAEDAEPVERPNNYWFEDCSAATENLLLAATADRADRRPHPGLSRHPGQRNPAGHRPRRLPRRDPRTERQVEPRQYPLRPLVAISHFSPTRNSLSCVGAV